MAGSLVAGVYEKTVDRESAYEQIKGRVEAGAAQPPAGARAGGAPGRGLPAGSASPTLARPGQTPQPAAESGMLGGSDSSDSSFMSISFM